MATSENKIYLIGDVIHEQEIGPRCRSPSYESGSWKDAVHSSCDSPNTSQRFAVGASNVCLWMMKTRRAPSRHIRDVWVYGQTTTAMRKLSTASPPFVFICFDSSYEPIQKCLKLFRRHKNVPNNCTRMFLFLFHNIIGGESSLDEQLSNNTRKVYFSPPIGRSHIT